MQIGSVVAATQPDLAELLDDGRPGVVLRRGGQLDADARRAVDERPCGEARADRVREPDGIADAGQRRHVLHGQGRWRPVEILLRVALDAAEPAMAAVGQADDRSRDRWRGNTSRRSPEARRRRSAAITCSLRVDRATVFDAVPR